MIIRYVDYLTKNKMTTHPFGVILKSTINIDKSTGDYSCRINKISKDILKGE